MQKDLIAVSEFCILQNVDISFIHSLDEYGLIEITTIDETGFLQANQLSEVERMTRLHRDLKINLEGIEAINHLIEKIKIMQDEINALKNRLHLYETGK